MTPTDITSRRLLAASVDGGSSRRTLEHHWAWRVFASYSSVRPDRRATVIRQESCAHQKAVIVTVIVVNVVKVPVDEVVDVIAMRDHVVAAVRVVYVPRAMPTAPMAWSASVWVRAVHCDRAFVDVVAVHRVEMAVVEIVNVAIMLDGAMPAVRPMDVAVTRVNLVVAHGGDPPDPFIEG